MSVEVNPVGKKCGAQAGGLSCTYCYQAVSRREEGSVPAVDMAAIKAAVVASGASDFSLFGGEALLAREEDLEALWSWAQEKFGRAGVQTSGRPIRPWHLEAFRRYRVHVGFSIDGPGELNDARRAGSIAQTREATAHSVAMLREMLTARTWGSRWGLPWRVRKYPGGASLIITLNATNTRNGRLARLVAWTRELIDLGLAGVRLHTLEHDGPAAAFLTLSHAENIAALDAFEAAGIETDVFLDIRALLRGEDENVTCVFAGCDPLETAAVHGIGPDGRRYGCDRAAKDGTWSPTPPGAAFRMLMLSETPQEDSGCKDCRFFVCCKGQCPGTAEGGDWRRRTRDCEMWKGLFSREEARLEAAGVVPVSKRPDLGEILARMRAAWAIGAKPSIKRALVGAVPAVDAHGHLDTAHVDWHTDHSDKAAR